MTHLLSIRSFPWRTVLLVLAYLCAVVLVPFGGAAFDYYDKAVTQALPMQPPSYSGALPALPKPDPGKKIAIVLAGQTGAEITDALPPFEILARSGAYNVYSVAPERTPTPLMPGAVPGASSLDFVPDFSFADYDAAIGTPPDLIVIPAVPNYTPDADAALLAWIRSHAGPHTTLLAICDGTTILADTGLMDGHSVTSNPADFDYIAAAAPTATLVPNVRYVDDGNIVTSSAVSSGIAATLHVVDRFVGRASALDVARQVGYGQTSVLDDPHFAPPQTTRLSLGLAAGLDAQQRLGVLVYDGVSEFGLAGLLDPYLSSVTARAFVMSPERKIVRSEGGLLLLPRYDFGAAPAVDRVLVAAGRSDSAERQAVITAWSTVQPARPAEDIYQNIGVGGSAYDVTFRDLARTHDAWIAGVIARALFYPSDIQFPDAAWPISQVLTALALSLIGAAAVFGASHLRIPRPRGVRVAVQPA